MSREAAVLITLVGYKICLVLIGWFYRKRTQSDVDFYLGGRQLGPLVAAVSASASSSSAWTLLGVSGAAYAWGLSAIWLFPGCVGGFLLNWYVLAPALHRTSREKESLTVTAFIASVQSATWSRRISVLSSLIILLSLGTYVAAQFQGAGKTFQETFGIPMVTSVLIGALIVLFYTFLGGFWAVSVTDTLQGLLMAATSLILPLAALVAVGGPLQLIDELHRLGDPALLKLTRNLLPASALGLILGLLGIGLGYPGQPHVVNRFMALDSRPQSLARARRIAVGWAVIVYAGMLTVGLCGRVLVPGLVDREVIFISLTNELFPPVISGIMLAAVLSAIMSTADSQLLVASSSVSHDLGAWSHSHISSLTRSRIVVVILSAAATVGALIGSQEIFSRVLFAWAAMGCAFGPLLLILTRSDASSGRRRFATILIGFGLSVGAFYLWPAASTWKGFGERVLPFLVALLVVASTLRKRGRDD